MLEVLVVMGGFSPERDVSLSSGRQILQGLDKNKYKVSSLELSKREDLKEFFKYQSREDFIIFNAMHGTFGEDGSFQGFLDSLGIKYTGCGVLASSLCMDKQKSKEILERYKIKIPKYYVLEKDFDFAPSKGFKKAVVKPNNQGSSIGVTIADNKNTLEGGIKEAFKYSDKVLVEEFISGMEVTVGILGDIILPVVEIVPAKNKLFYSYDSKYEDGGSEHIIPARLSKTVENKIKHIAKSVYKALNCSVYSRVDMLVSGTDVYVLEVNTLPGMTPTSLLPQAAENFGISFPKLLDKIILLSHKV